MSRVLSRHWQLISFILVVIIIFWLLYALRSAVLPFVVGLVLAYLLLPVISWIEMRLPHKGKWRQAKRVSIIVLFFIVILALVGFLSYAMASIVVNAFLALVENAPQFIIVGLHRLQEWAELLRQQFPPEARQQVDQFILDAGAKLGRALQDVVTKGISFIPATFSLFFGFAALPLFLFYILKDAEKLKANFYTAVPSWVAEHTRNIALIIERVLGRYIRAQLVLGFIVAYFIFVGLLILRVQFAPALAILAGLTELIPIAGPWIGGAVAVIFTLAVAPQKAIWVALLFLIVQLLENSLLVPRIQGGYLRINPAIAIFLLVLGAYIAGFWGVLLAVPLAATVVEIYKYVYHSIKAEDTQQIPQP